MNIIQSPFNYTGSKANLIEQLHKSIPLNCSICYDIFCGGGGFFINSLDQFNTIIANDIISPLIQFYQWLQITKWDDVLNIINQTNISLDNQEDYVNLRNKFNQEKNFIDFFILVCSCTNNMMRFNKKYQFNQTWGKRHFNNSTQQRLKEYHNRIFRNAKIQFENKNFYNVDIEDNSFVYLDPPYLISEAGYNAYWSKNLEEKLYDYLDELDNKNIKFMLSNIMEHKGISNPYKNRIKKYNIIELNFDYKKIAKKQKEEKTTEIIVTNY